MTLDDLELPKCHACRNKKFYGARQKKYILSAAKCRPMILVSRNIRYMRIFAGDPSGKGRQVQ